jgi:hypothetical protein
MNKKMEGFKARLSEEEEKRLLEGLDCAHSDCANQNVRKFIFNKYRSEKDKKIKFIEMSRQIPACAKHIEWAKDTELYLYSERK